MYKFFLTLTVLVMAWPSVAFMQAVTLPEFNPVCWREKMCAEYRTKLQPTLSDREKKAGWIANQEPCVGEDWGKCLPANTTQTEVSFGGRTQFLHIGDFIQAMYRYAIGVASVVAVVMIIIAGFQWASSGGNSEAISSAQHRIVGAVIGLFIAYTSYFILNLVNPALVNLRLPQVYMIRPQELVPKFCAAIPDSLKLQPDAFALAADTNDQRSAVTPNDKTVFNATFKNENPSDNNEKNFYCGKRFFLKNGGPITCFGDYCDAGSVCVNFGGGDQQNLNKYYCKEGLLAGNIGGSVGGSSVVVDNNIKLIALCSDGSIEQVSDYDVPESLRPQHYVLPRPDEKNIITYCGGGDKLVGFYLGVEANDETGGLGALGEGGVTGVGNDDWFAVGQVGPNSHTCSVNLSPIAIKAVTDVTVRCSRLEFGCSCSLLSSKVGMAKAVKLSDFTQHLISLAELQKGYNCDIIMDRSEFPAMCNESGCPAPETGDKSNLSLLTGIFTDMIFKGLADPTNCFAEK